jgi:O-methyltransferase
MQYVKRWIRRAVNHLGYSVIRTSEYADLDARRKASSLLQQKLGELTRELASANLSLQPTIGKLLEELKVVRATDPDYQLLMAQQNLLAAFDDLDPGFRPIMELVKPYTMTSLERMYNLYKSVEYLVRAKIPGDMLECGVWRGGSMMLVAKSLLAVSDTSRRLYLFDTYEGHPKPDSEHDVDLWGNPAVHVWTDHRRTDETSDWAYVSIDEVRANMGRTGYPMDKVELVKGMVEKTAMTHAPGALSLIRLDTDWYASAKVSLERFWPQLSRGGVLIIDDYGHYRGQRRAVDEYFAGNPVLLHRIDYCCRTIVKTR